MAGRMTLSLVDNNRETAQLTLDHEQYASDGSNYAAVLGGAVSLRDAILGVTLGVQRSILVGGNYTLSTNTRANDADAQTNIQWRAYYEDTVNGRRFSVRIPTADLQLIEIETRGGIDFQVLPLATGAGQTLKAAWDNFVFSEDGNPTILSSVEYLE